MTRLLFLACVVGVVVVFGPATLPFVVSPLGVLLALVVLR